MLHCNWDEPNSIISTINKFKLDIFITNNLEVRERVKA